MRKYIRYTKHGLVWDKKRRNTIFVSVCIGYLSYMKYESEELITLVFFFFDNTIRFTTYV